MWERCQTFGPIGTKLILARVYRFTSELTSAKTLTSRAPRAIWRGLGSHTLKIVGNMPNSWTDRDQIWHTYAYFSGNGHELNINQLITEGYGGLLGGHRLINLGKLPNHWTDRDQIWHTHTDSSGN